MTRCANCGKKVPRMSKDVVEVGTYGTELRVILLAPKVRVFCDGTCAKEWLAKGE